MMRLLATKRRSLRSLSKEQKQHFLVIFLKILQAIVKPFWNLQKYRKNQRQSLPLKKIIKTVKKVFASRRKSHYNAKKDAHNITHYEEDDSGFASLSSMCQETTGQACREHIDKVTDANDKECGSDNSCNESTDASHENDEEDPEALAQLAKLQTDISRLKFDKLELLRQNVDAQREVKK